MHPGSYGSFPLTGCGGMTVCTLVVPPGSALAKFSGKTVKISAVLEIIMNHTVDVDEKKLQTREKARRYHQMRREETQIWRARMIMIAARAAP